MNNLKYVLTIAILLNFSSTIDAQFDGFQEVPDSLIIKSYNSLYSFYYNSFDNLPSSNVYATAFLKKAYLKKDTLNITNGYYMITYHVNDETVVYNDSLLKYASFLSSDQSDSFSWYAYQSLGSYYSSKRDFKKSFDNHIMALNAAKRVDNIELLNISTTNLGLLKERIGKYSEALVDFKNNYQYEVRMYENETIFDSVLLKPYLNSICLLANSFMLNKQYDSAQYYNNKVFEYKDYPGAERYMGLAGVNTAEVQYALGNYKGAINSIKSALPVLQKEKNTPNIAVAHYLRGMSLAGKKDNMAIKDLVLMDSIFMLNNDLQPSLRAGYLYLIDHFKKESDLYNQVYYVEQLLKFDSIVNDYSMHVADGVYNEERKNLLITQENLKSEIKSASLTNKIIFSASCLIISLLVFEIFRRKRMNKKKIREYQIRFDNLLKTKYLETSTQENNTGKPGNSDISDSLINEIVLKLDSFELRNGFLDKKISANRLAKELETNANYLGQIVKLKSGENFRQYINNLRIEYILKVLREDRKMINFSIQAIANEAGYNHAEPFSKAFKVRTGYYPSDFIVKIKENGILNSTI